MPMSTIGASRIETDELHHVSSISEKESHNFVRRDELEQADQLAQQETSQETATEEL